MKTRIITAIVLLCNIVSVTAQTWQPVGTTGFSTPVTQYSLTSLAIDNNGIPFVAYSDASLAGKLTVMKFNGSSWVIVGTAGFTSDQGYDMSLAFDAANIPYVAFGDAGNSSYASVMKFNGTNWVNVGAAGFSDGVINNCTLKFGGNDTAYVAYVDAAYSGRAVVKKFDGINWVNIGNAGFTAGGTGQMTMALSNNNVPYIAYQDQANGFGLSSMMFDGNNWVHVGSATFSNGVMQFAHITFDNAGTTPYICYNQGYNPFSPNVQLYNGSSWVYVGGQNLNTNVDYQNNIALDGNNIPYVIFPDGAYSSRATVMNYDGSAWVTTGNAGFSIGEIWYPNIATDAQNNVYVEYYDAADNNKISVMKFGTCSAIQTSNNVSLCQGDSVFAGGSYQTTPGNYSDTYTASNGCDSIVTTLIQYTFTFDLGNTVSNCSGENVLLNAGVAGATYLWSTGETTQIIMVTQTNNYAVTVTENGCSVSDNVNVSFQPGPVVNLGSDTGMCANNSIVLNAGSNGVNYLWNTGTTDSTLSVNTSGNYAVTVMGVNGCSTDDSVQIEVHPLPSISLGEDTTICEGTPFEVNAGVGFQNYQWQDSSTAQSFNFPGSTPIGDYAVNVTVTDGFGCANSDSITVTIEICGGINFLSENNFHLFPNPVTDEINVLFNKAGNYYFTIYNLLGEQVKNSSSVISNEMKLNISDLPSGIYELVISNNEQVMTKKFVKE